ALLQGERSPYGTAELELLAEHCTQQEDAAQKVERSVRKSEAALYLQGMVGQKFDAVVTGRSESGTWVRIFTPPAEGMLVGGGVSLDVGQQLRVKLVHTNVERGFIDFEQML
ncbi:MAG: RNB domain-containing ribonuclease, partial [Giesbergeria sp.]